MPVLTGSSVEGSRREAVGAPIAVACWLILILILFVFKGGPMDTYYLAIVCQCVSRQWHAHRALQTPRPCHCCCQRLRLRLLVVVCVPVIRQLRQQLLR